MLQGERGGGHRAVKVPKGTLVRGNGSSGGCRIGGRVCVWGRGSLLPSPSVSGRAAAPGAAVLAAPSAALGTLRGGGTEEGRPGGRRGRPALAKAVVQGQRRGSARPAAAGISAGTHDRSLP